MKCTAQTEQEMREYKVPFPQSLDDLTEFIISLTERRHDYGSSAYAMSLAATAAFNYIGSKLGTTGFQASCADLDFLRRTRGLDGPFIIMKAEDMLYPRYSLPGKLAEAMDKWGDWVADQAKKKLSESDDTEHPNVRAHWVKLAGD